MKITSHNQAHSAEFSLGSTSTDGLKRGAIVWIGAALIITGLVMLLPLDEWIDIVLKDSFISEYLALAVKMGVIFILGYSLIKKFNIFSLAGVSKKEKWNFQELNLIPVYLFVLGIMSVVTQDPSTVNLLNVLLLLVACLMVGFAEEFLFRGYIQSTLLKRFVHWDKGIFISVGLSSLCFGILHFINIFTGAGLIRVMIQVVYATFIGFFFGALLLKTNKLVPIAITHGLINFFFSLPLLPSLQIMEEESIDNVSIAPILITLPLLIAGILICRTINKTKILEKVESDSTLKF